MEESRFTDVVLRAANSASSPLSHKLVMILLVGVVIGLVLGDDYGNSWDEHYNKVYAEHTIQMYLGDRVPRDTITDMRFYGPAFNVPWLVGRNLFDRLIPSWTRSDAGHFLYWLAFLPAPVLVYAMSRRWAGRTASIGGALLFALQPVVFGHAFINPKDIPFMTAFLAALWLGLEAVDLSINTKGYLPLEEIPSEVARLIGELASSLHKATRWRAISFYVLWTLFGLVALDLLVTHKILKGSLLLIESAYTGRAPDPMIAMFNLFATDAHKTPLATYWDKARDFHTLARLPLLAAGGVLSILLSLRILGHGFSRRWILRRKIWWYWLAAAIALGLCSAIRVFGPFAGLLVAVYGLVRLRSRALRPMVAYGLLGMIVLYAAWPSLWGKPFQHLADSLFRMGRFPWQGRLLYDRQLYAVTEIPWHYAPRSILMRLTLPAIFLSFAGVLAVLVETGRKRRIFARKSPVLIWLGLPIALMLLFRVQIYSAFRQLMFLIPALFIFASFAYERLIALSRKRVWAPLLIGISIAPGLIGIVRLHPYEMAYYNELVGGVSGAAGRYELGTWGTTYREAIEYVNEIAPEGARVLVDVPEFHTITPFARDDLQIGRLTETALQSSPTTTYIISAEPEPDSVQAEPIYVIERTGASLAAIRVLH